MTLFEHPFYAHIAKYGALDKRRMNLDFHQLPEQLHALAVTVETNCVACGALIKCLRARVKSERSRVGNSATERRLYYTSTCSTEVNPGCSRTHASKQHKALLIAKLSAQGLARGVSPRDNTAIAKKAQAAGASFESWLEGQHVMAHHLGILAHVEKTEPHAKVINGRVEFVKKGVADYVGCLTATGCACGGGKSLAVEAKSTVGDRLMRSAVSTKQSGHLDAVALAGGLALLLVEFRLGVNAAEALGMALFTRYSIPWLEVPWKILRTAESVSVGDVQQWKIEPGACYLSKFHPRGKITGSVSAVGGKHRVLARD